MISGTRLLLACGSNAFLPTAKAALSSAHASLVSATLTSCPAWQEMSAQTQRVSAWGDKTTPSCLGSSRSFASSSKPVYVDPFRDSLQGKPDLAAAAGEGQGEEMVKVYDVRSGVVKAIMPYGVYVDIGTGHGLDPLLHGHEISSETISAEDIGKMFSVGDHIKVMVIRADNGNPKTPRLTVSTRSLEVTPGDMVKDPQLVYSTAEEAAAAFRAKVEASNGEEGLPKRDGKLDPNLKVHEVRSGVVKGVINFGVFVDIGAGRDGLLHKSEISSDPISRQDLQKMFSVGDEIKISALILSVRKKMFRVGDKIKVMVQSIGFDSRIVLGTKSLEVNPGDMVKNPQLVYEKADEAAAAFRAKLAASEPEMGVKSRKSEN
eukprot:gene27395-biopygen3242